MRAPVASAFAAILIVSMLMAASHAHYSGLKSATGATVVNSVLNSGVNTVDTVNTCVECPYCDCDNTLSQLSVCQEKNSEIRSETEHLRAEISDQAQLIEHLSNQVSTLEDQAESLNDQLAEKTSALEEVSGLLRIAEMYQLRVNQGISREEAFRLLSDYDMTSQMVESFTSNGYPSDATQFWARAKDVYNWLGEHFRYCSDRGICIGEYCAQMQYFSPDEMLYYGSLDYPCGDCDDQAHLFAGMMYASGVPHESVRVECGSVDMIGHCWNSVLVNGKWYRVDPVCSDADDYLKFFGISIQLSGKAFPSYPQNVDCFPSYSMEVWYNPDGFHPVDG